MLPDAGRLHDVISSPECIPHAPHADCWRDVQQGAGGCWRACVVPGFLQSGRARNFGVRLALTGLRCAAKVCASPRRWSHIRAVSE